jgi:hypothetical protein
MTQAETVGPYNPVHSYANFAIFKPVGPRLPAHSAADKSVPERLHWHINCRGISPVGVEGRDVDHENAAANVPTCHDAVIYLLMA